MHRLLVLALCLLPSVAEAAIEYRVTIDRVGDPVHPHRVLRVVVDGQHRRVEVQKPEANPIPFDLFLADLDQRPGFTALNTDLKTWWYPISPLPLRVAHGFPSMKSPVVRKVRVISNEEDGSELIEGFRTRKFVVHAGYEVAGSVSDTPVAISHQITMMIWTTDRLDASLAIAPLPSSTDFEEVDVLLRKQLQTITGFPLRVVVSAGEAWQGGKARTTVETTTVSNVREIPSDPHQFDFPSGYVKRDTVIAAPGAAQ